MAAHEPKISDGEIVLITPFFIIVDGLGVGLALFALDDFFLIDIVRFPLTQFYLRMKGVKGRVDLVSNILETVPYLGALPISTVGWFMTIWADRHPEGSLAKGLNTKALGSTKAKPSLKKLPGGKDGEGKYNKAA